jgi:hypothetical protein
MTGRAPIRPPRATAAALILVGLALGGCGPDAGTPQAAGSNTGPPSAGPPASSPGSLPSPSGGSAGTPKSTEPPPSAGSDVHLRSIGPVDQGHEIVLRIGDRLDVTPAARPGGWVVADFPPAVLRLQGSPRAATRHTFLAFAVGEGSLTLSPAGPEANATGAFIVKVRVVRDTVLPPQP